MTYTRGTRFYLNLGQKLGVTYTQVIMVFIHTVHKTDILLVVQGISGNERADSATKAALQKDVSEFLISYTDAYQYISHYIHNLRQRECNTAVNRLHAIKPLIGEQPSTYISVHRDKVVLSRLKLGHSYLKHSYLLKSYPRNVSLSLLLFALGLGSS